MCEVADAEKTAPGLPETCSALSPSWGLKLMKVSSPRAKPRRVAPTPSLGSKCQASERAAGRSGQVQGLPQRPRARPPKPRGGGAASGTGAAGSGVPRERPGAKCPRQPQPPRPVPPVEPAHGRYSRRRLRWAGTAGTAGASGCAARGSALLPASCPPAEPRRSRGGGAAGPVPGAGWRRAPRPGTGVGAPPAGSPPWTAAR